MAEQLADLQLRYSELQNDPPKPIPTDDLDRQLRDAELAIERLNAKPYESKFTAALAETTAALNLAMREHGRTTLLLDGLKPNMKCPSCQRTVTAENLVDVKLELTQNLDAILQRGRNLRAQLGDLQGLDADSRKTFDRFVRTDVEKHTALMTQLTTQREILLAQQQRFAAAHEGNLQALYTQIRTLDTDITVGNLSIDETQTLSSLYAAKLDAQAELSALEVLCAREEPDLDARLADAAAQIKQKNILISAAVDYLAKRNELTFRSLSMPHVKISLYDLIKTTGELKNAFRFTYNDRDYRRLSRSERLLAGLEVSDLIKRLSGRNYPVFIDDLESSEQLPPPSGQLLMARMVAKTPLAVQTKNVSAPLKKAS